MRKSIESEEVLQLLVDVEDMMRYTVEDESYSALQEVADKLISMLGIENEDR